MKLITYRSGGRVSYGAVVDGGVVDLAKRLPQQSLKALLAAGAVGEAKRAIAGQAPDVKLADIVYLPPVPDPDKIICIGLNYDDHRKETGREKTAYPTLFTRFADTQVGHGQAMVKPKSSDKLDYEGELAVIIGKRGRHVPKERALDHVAGYSCYHDGSVRDWQFHTSQFVPGKNFPATGGFGPWMVTADEIPDPTKLTLVTRLNGQEVQRAGTDLMIFPIPELIAYITTFTELAPGDVIPTGTPAGVGSKRTPPLFMKPGDIAEVDISNVGVLKNAIIGE
ncbi:MAG: fumarylacetoacetate hydrolase family protein [Alphaproteobacteria bacterium]|nr:fumarylacetoacetate hydrolase family protein [Alphaproteobacteria bacterium]